MRRAFQLVSFTALICVAVFLTASASAQKSSVPISKSPDLSRLPVMTNATLRNQSRARVSYDVSSGVAEAYRFHSEQLSKMGWKELEGGYESDASCNGSFEREGYKLSLSAFATGEASKTNVMLMQHGKVDLTKLSLPADLKILFRGPVSASFSTDVPVKQTKVACRESLVNAGWEPYGVAGDSLMFRKDMTRLTAFIGAAPAQGGKTMAQFSSELLSADIPLFPGSSNAQYSDNPTQLSFDSGKSMDDVVAFYKQTLAPSGWKPTTDSLIKISIYDVMIFRNPSRDMMELRLHLFDDQARGLLRFVSAEQVDALEQLAEKEAKQRMSKAVADKDSEFLAVDVPAGAKEVEIEKDSIGFQLAAGQARKVAEGWQQEFVKSDWKEQTSVLQDVAGAIVLMNGTKTLTITYTDTGFMPAEVTIDAFGIELKRKGSSPEDDR